MRRRMLMQMGSAIPSADIVILTGELTETSFTMTTADKSAFEYNYTDANGVSYTELGTSGTKYTLSTLPNSTIFINGLVSTINAKTTAAASNIVRVELNAYENLTTVNFGNNAKLVNVSNFEKLNILKISAQSFAGCTNVQLNDIPSSVNNIEGYCFQNCRNLQLKSLPSGLTIIGNFAFQSCKSLQLKSLPSGLTSIGWGAFGGCNNISLTSLPSVLTSIGKEAFLGCTKITDIKILNTTAMITSAASMFNAGTTIRVPNALFSQYQADTNWSTYNLIGY